MTQTWTFFNVQVQLLCKSDPEKPRKKSWKKYSQSIHDMFHFRRKKKTQTNPQLSIPHTWRKQSILQIHIAVVFDCESFIHIMSHITHQYTYSGIHTVQLYRSQRHIKPHWGHKKKKKKKNLQYPDSLHSSCVLGTPNMFLDENYTHDILITNETKQKHWFGEENKTSKNVVIKLLSLITMFHWSNIIWNLNKEVWINIFILLWTAFLTIYLN